MSGSLNKVMLIGNLGRDPELKMTPAGQAVARFSVATTETWKNPQGEKQSKTEWHNIVVWGKPAETAEKYLKKGKQVLVEGRIQYREYTNQAGEKKTACEIRCDNFVMLGQLAGGRDQGGAAEEDAYAGARQAPASSGAPDTWSDDIPF